jgi:hypothetical protein
MRCNTTNLTSSQLGLHHLHHQWRKVLEMRLPMRKVIQQRQDLRAIMRRIGQIRVGERGRLDRELIRSSSCSKSNVLQRCICNVHLLDISFDRYQSNEPDRTERNIIQIVESEQRRDNNNNNNNNKIDLGSIQPKLLNIEGCSSMHGLCVCVCVCVLACDILYS